jgi:hypothetical protein
MYSVTSGEVTAGSGDPSARLEKSPNVDPTPSELRLIISYEWFD